MTYDVLYMVHYYGYVANPNTLQTVTRRPGSDAYPRIALGNSIDKLMINKVFPLSTQGGSKNFNGRSNRSQIAPKIDGAIYPTGSGNVGLTHFLMKHLERSGKNCIV